jgi:hypothetical protein
MEDDDDDFGFDDDDFVLDKTALENIDEAVSRYYSTTDTHKRLKLESQPQALNSLSKLSLDATTSAQPQPATTNRTHIQTEAIPRQIQRGGSPLRDGAGVARDGSEPSARSPSVMDEGVSVEEQLASLRQTISHVREYCCFPVL